MASLNGNDFAHCVCSIFNEREREYGMFCAGGFQRTEKFNGAIE